MKMMKLLGAASVAALIAGAAHAQLQIVQSDLDAAGLAGPDLPTITAPIMVAEEIDFTLLSAEDGSGDAGVVGLEVLTQGQIPPGQNIFLTIEVTNGVFAANLDGDEVVEGDTGSVVQTGGSLGDNTVQYLITTDADDENYSAAIAAGTDSVALNLPILMSSCGDLTFSVTQFQTETAGTVIEGGAATLLDAMGDPQPAATCVDAFVGTLQPDSGANSATSINFASGFTDFVDPANPLAVVGADIIGEFEMEVTPMVFKDFGNTAATFADVDGFEASVDFDDITGIGAGAAASTGGGLFTQAGTISGNSIVMSDGIPATGDATGTFTITADGTDPMMAQQVTASGGILILDDADFLQASDPFLLQDVEDLVFNGSTFGPFDWVADTSGRVNSIFRVTGLDALTTDIPALLITENSRNGASFNGVFPFTVSMSEVQGSEVRYTSSTLEGIAGAFGTADVTMVFGGDLDLDVDRLLSGPSTATVVPFGDGANDAGAQGDDATTRATTDNDDEGNF